MDVPRLQNNLPQILDIMKPRTFAIFEIAIEEGIEYGWRRAHKHTDSPSEDTIKEEISNAIFSELHKYFSFDEEDFS